MSRGLLQMACLASLTCALTACQASGRSGHSICCAAVGTETYRHALFNPDPVNFPVQEFDRYSWPDALNHQITGESIDYVETVVDWQGRNFSDRDLYYRRFDAVRTGRAFR